MLEKNILENSELFINLIKKEQEKKKKEIKPKEDNVIKDISINLRIRPLLENEVEQGSFETCFKSNDNYTKASLYEPTIKFNGQPSLKTNSFNFDYVFDQFDNNEKVYKHTVEPIVELVLSGALGVCLCYGQTGSGKTYSITGIEEYLANDIFNKMNVVIENMNLKSFETYNDKPFQINVSFFEILGNKCYDLLNDKFQLSIYEDKFGEVIIKDLKEIECTNSDELLNYVNIGFSHRRTHATLKNDTSSRSHAICKIRIKNTVINQANDGILYLVDLAGSERHADSKFHDSDRLKETKEINSSLFTLKECIRARSLASLGLEKHIHIPFRTSKLTMLLKETFDLETCTRPCTTIFIANVSPNCLDCSHTLNTLRYSSPLKISQKSNIDILAKKAYNPDDPYTWEYENAREWVTLASNNLVQPEDLLPFKENGIQLSNIPEMEFIRRCLLSKKMSEIQAKKFYLKLWRLIIDTRTKQKRKKLTSTKSSRRKALGRETDFDKELIKRVEEEKRLGIDDEQKKSALEIMKALNGTTL